jgi:hypothetical protein
VGSNRITIGQRSRDLLSELAHPDPRLVDLGELGELTLGVARMLVRSASIRARFISHSERTSV